MNTSIQEKFNSTGTENPYKVCWSWGNFKIDQFCKTYVNASVDDCLTFTCHDPTTYSCALGIDLPFSITSIFSVVVNLLRLILVFNQLRLSTDHHEGVSINTPPQVAINVRSSYPQRCPLWWELKPWCSRLCSTTELYRYPTDTDQKVFESCVTWVLNSYILQSATRYEVRDILIYVPRVLFSLFLLTAMNKNQSTMFFYT